MYVSGVSCRQRSASAWLTQPTCPPVIRHPVGSSKSSLVPARIVTMCSLPGASNDGPQSSNSEKPAISNEIPHPPTPGSRRSPSRRTSEGIGGLVGSEASLTLGLGAEVGTLAGAGSQAHRTAPVRLAIAGSPPISRIQSAIGVGMGPVAAVSGSGARPSNRIVPLAQSGLASTIHTLPVVELGW